MNNNNPIVIIGGYGVVGSEIARLIRSKYSAVPIAVAGRSLQKAHALQKELRNISFIEIDINNSDSLKNLPVNSQVIVCAANDKNNFILSKAVEEGIPYIDITRWTDKLIPVIDYLKLNKPKAPVILASSWMAGISVILARQAMSGLEKPESVNIDILYSLTDKAGPNSIEFIDQFDKSFSVIKNGCHELIKPLSESHVIYFPEVGRFRTFRFSTPEQYTLPLNTDLSSATTRISFNSTFLTWMLVSFVRSGLWKLISSDRFKKLRHSILYNPGDGGTAVVTVEACSNRNKNRITAIDNKGQYHLTAVGVLIQIERILGLDNAVPPSGVVFPEQCLVLGKAIQTMKECGVKLIVD